MRAVWNGAVLAESDDTVVVEGNHYFPPDSGDRRYLKEGSATTSPFGATSRFNPRPGPSGSRSSPTRIRLLADYEHHPSLHRYVNDGYQVITF